MHHCSIQSHDGSNDKYKLGKWRDTSLPSAAVVAAVAEGGGLESSTTCCCKQGCESRRQTFSSITGPTFRDFGKVPALPRSLTLLGKKVPPGSGPLFGFSRPNPAGNEIPIETEILNSPPPPPPALHNLPFAWPRTEHWKMKNFKWKKIAVLTTQKYKNMS